MTFPTARAFLLLSTITLGAAAAFAATGCDDSTDGTGGSGTTSSGSMTTSSTGASMTTSTGTGSSMSTGTGVTMTEWDAYCDARGALNCMGFDVAACKMQQTCALNLLRDEIEKDLLMCGQMGCDGENCLAVGATKPLSAIGMEFQTACNNYVTNCPGVSDDECGYPFVLSDAELSEALPCFSMGNCPMKESCIQAYAAANIDVCESWL